MSAKCQKRTLGRMVVLERYALLERVAHCTCALEVERPPRLADGDTTGPRSTGHSLVKAQRERPLMRVSSVPDQI
jgi:hypothetical protein